MKKRPSFSDDVTPVLSTLSEACIHSARYSLKLCQDEWTSGSIAAFGYAFPAFIFSSALVLIASSLLPMGNTSDLASAETGIEMLRVLSDSNNLAAKDLHEKLQFVRQCVEHHRYSMANARNPTLKSPVLTHDNFNASNQPLPVDPLPVTLPQSLDSQMQDLSTGTALQSSLMEEFLTQPVSTVNFLDLGEFPLEFDAEFLWSENALIAD